MNIITLILAILCLLLAGILVVHRSKRAKFQNSSSSTSCEEISAELYQVYESLPIGFGLYDVNGMVRFINHKGLDMLGATSLSQLLAKSLFDNPNYPKDQLDKLRESGDVNFSIFFDYDFVSDHFTPNKTGTQYIEMHFKAIYDKDREHCGYMSSMLNISQTTIMKKNLESSHQRLSEVIRSSEVALEAGKISVWKYDSESKEFSTVMGKALAGRKRSMKLNDIMLHPNDKERQEAIFKSLIDGVVESTSAVFRYKLKENDNEYRYFDTKMIAEHFKDGMSGIIGTQKDITVDIIKNRRLIDSERKATETNELLSTIIDTMPCLLFIKDIEDDYRYVLTNNMFAEYTGISTSNLTARSDFDLFDEEPAKKFREDDVCATSLGVGVAHIFEEFTYWKGVECCWHTIKTVCRAGDRRLLIGISLDITDVSINNTELKKAKDRAEQSDRLKSAFLANISHEIRTPLNAIVGFSDLMTTSDSDLEKKLYISIIKTNTSSLLNLITDILDLSKIESGYMDFKITSFDIVELLSEIKSTLASRVCSGVDFYVNSPKDSLFVELDKLRVNQVAVNFVTNAIKFTKEGEIVLGCEYSDNGVTLYVKDTGCGISEENILKVFERFEKFNHFEQGTGLGMPISKAIVEMCGGEMGVESELGKGSCFWAYLPCKFTV